jgi:hypothetical protein
MKQEPMRLPMRVRLAFINIREQVPAMSQCSDEDLVILFALYHRVKHKNKYKDIPDYRHLYSWAMSFNQMERKPPGPPVAGHYLRRE